MLAADERRRLYGEVGLVEALEWREVTGAELVDRLRRGEVLEPMNAEVVQGVGGGEVAGRLRDEDLAAVTCRGDAGSAVNVDADVPFLSQQWLAGVQAHAHADRAQL